jgi:RNA polymerase-binding transcription factor DksA
MAKAKKKAKAKARLNDKVGQAKPVKKVKKAASKKTKKAAVKKSTGKKPVKKKPVAKKVAAKKKPVAKKKIAKVIKKKSVRKVVANKETKKVVVNDKKEAKAVKTIQQVKPVVPLKPIPAEKPEKEKKKTKEELAEEIETLGEETYSWDSGTFSDMKNYEPIPVYRKPDPPQPKFKGKQDKRTRYSDKELDEFREIINEKVAEAERDYELLKNTLAHRDEHGTDDTSPTFKVLEDGSDAMSREEIAQLASRQERHIQNLKNALIRIENKTYGICRVTGKLIPKERLRSVPHATLSIEAKLTQNS